MVKFIPGLVLFILLVTACGRAAEIPPTPQFSFNTSAISPAASPATTAMSTAQKNPPTQAAQQAANSLAVISASNARDLDKITVLTGSSDRITDLAFSADGAFLASTGYEELIRLWEVSTWQEVASFPLEEADLNALAFSPDGSLLASGQSIWNVETKEIVHTLKEHPAEPSFVAFSPDGTQLAIAADRRIIVLDVSSWDKILAFDYPADSLWLFGISFSPDGKWLASSSGANGKVYFWSAGTGELAFTLEQGNVHDIHDIAFSPDGLYLATGGTDSYARIWSIAASEVIQKMPIIGMYSLALSPDGTLLATAGPDRSVKLWNVQNGSLVRSLPHADELMAVAFSADGRLIASGSYDKTITIWGIKP